jgi:hypothetical protein
MHYGDMGVKKLKIREYGVLLRAFSAYICYSTVFVIVFFVGLWRIVASS